MKEWFLQPEDGEEFKVFYLGDGSNAPNKPNKEIHEHGVSGCCPIGPKGETGEKGVSLDPTKGVQGHQCPPSIFLNKEVTPSPFDCGELHLDPTMGGVWEEDESFTVDGQQKDEFIKKLFMHPDFLEASKKYKKKGEKLAVKIDDTIESDIIKEPVLGRIYKVLGLNMIVRFMGECREQRLDETGESLHHLWRLDYHRNNFFISVDDKRLVKATDYEVEMYLENEE